MSVPVVAKQPLVLGIGAVPGGGACLLRGAHPLVAIEEMRLSRIVGDPIEAVAPSLAVQYCLDAAGTTLGDLDLVACAVHGSDGGWRSDVALNPQLQIASRGLALHTVPVEEARKVGDSIVRGASSGAWTSAGAVTVGAAFCGLHAVTGRRAQEVSADALRGRQYTDDEVQAAGSTVPGLARAGAIADLLDELSDRMARGQVGGWFHGQSRFGQDARPQRSLLCVLPRQGAAARGHPVGGTPRTFEPVASPPRDEAGGAWRSLAGRLTLFSASFHGDDEPIVETPADALWACVETGLDFCVLEDRVFVPNGSFASLLDLVPSLRPVAYTISYALQDGRLPTTAARARVTAESSTRWGTMTARVNPLQRALLEVVDGRWTGHQLLERLNDRRTTMSGAWLLRNLIQLRRLGLLDLTRGAASGDG